MGQEVDLHLLDHGARHATLQIPEGEVELRSDFSRWVICTLRSKDFVCLEPWTAPANALNSGECLIALDPGEVRAVDLAIAVR